jgi:hypothetical protein
MATLTSILDRNGITYAIVSTVAIGLISTFAAWGHRTSRTRACSRRTQRQANEMECRYMIASWMADPDDPVWCLFSTGENRSDRTRR